MRRYLESYEANHRNKLEQFLWIIVGIFFVIKLFEALCFIDYYDPFVYHLAFPKAWYETSFHQAMLDNDTFLLAGIFDYLYIIPMFLTSADPYPAQIIAQLMHFLSSLGAGAFLLARYFKSKIFAPLAALSILSISKSATFFMVAKNDGTLSFVVLFTFILIFDDDFIKKLKGLKRIIFIGIMLGIIPAIKLNGLLYATVLGTYCLLKNRKNCQKIIFLILSSVFVLSLTLIKNWIYIKNPLFPGVISKIPGEASKEMIAYFTYYMDSSFNKELIIPHLKCFFLGKMIYLASIISLVYLFIKNKNSSKNFFQSNIVIFIVSVLCYGLYLLVNGGLPTYRFVFPVYFLLTFFIFCEWKKYEKFLSKLKWLPFFALILILADSKIDKSISRLYQKYQDRHLTHKEIVRKEFPYSEFWDYVEPSTLNEKTYIISDYLSQMYYSPKGFRVQCSLVDRRAGFLHTCDDISLLKKYKYAFIKENRNNPCYDKIKKEGKLLHHNFGIKLFDIREL